MIIYIINLYPFMRFIKQKSDFKSRVCETSGLSPYLKFFVITSIVTSIRVDILYACHLYKKHINFLVFTDG